MIVNKQVGRNHWDNRIKKERLWRKIVSMELAKNWNKVFNDDNKRR